MQIRRMLLPIVFSIPLAGAMIWFALQHQSPIPTPTIVEKAAVAAPISPLPHSAPVYATGSHITAMGAYPSDRRFHVVKPARNVSTLPKRFLPEESRLIADGQVNEDAVQTILHSAQFDDFVRKMRDEMMADAAANDVSELYIGAVKSSLGDMPELTMGEFACGVTVCAGSIEATGERSAWEQWMKKFENNPRAPTYALVEYSAIRDNGATQYRIVFSTDPDSSSITKSF